MVSIPLSEFCWLKHGVPSRLEGYVAGFNSPLGILLVEATAAELSQAEAARFQFPSRNSVG